MEDVRKNKDRDQVVDYIQHEVITEKKTVTIKDVCKKLKVDKATALISFEKFLGIQEVNCLHVVSGTTGNCTEVFLVRSSQHETTFDKFDKIDFHHQYSISPGNQDAALDNDQSTSNLKEESSLKQENKLVRQASIQDFFKQSYASSSNNVPQKLKMESKERQLTLKSYFKPKPVPYCKRSWLRNIVNEFKVIEEADITMSCQDDQLLLDALKKYEADEDENKGGDDVMSSLDDSFLSHAIENYEEASNQASLAITSKDGSFLEKMENSVVGKS